MADERLEIEITLDDGSIVKGFTKLDRQAKKTAKGLSNSFSEFGTRLAGQLKTAALAYASFRIIGSVAKDLSDFGKALAEIKTIVSDTAAINDDFTRSLVDISTQFGISAQEQAKSFYQIISAGVTDSVKANELLIASNKLAIGGLADSAASIDILTSAVNSYGQGVLSAEKASDVLFGTVKLGKTTVSQLASNLGQVLPVAKSVGVTFEEVNAAIATLTLRGLSTSEAVTQLNAVFTAVLKKQELAVQMGPRVANAFSQQALQSKGLALFLEDLSVALGGSSEKLVKLLGRVEGAKAIIALGADGFKKLNASIAELGGSAGAAQSAFDIIVNTIAFQFDKLKTIASNIGLAISLPFRTLAVDGLKSMNTLGIGILNFVQDVTPALLFLADSIEAIAVTFRAVSSSIMTGAQGIVTAILFVVDGLLTLVAASGLTNDKFREMATVVRELKDASVESFAAMANSTNEALFSNDLFTRTFSDNAESIRAKIEGLKSGFAAFGNTASSTAKQASLDYATAARGIIGSMALITKGLVTGENGFEQFLASILNIFGDLLIQAGTAAIGIGKLVEAIRNSLNFLTGGIAIAAGFAAIALGGILKGVASGLGGSQGGGGVAGSSTVAEGAAATDEPEVAAQQQTGVTVVVQGDILDAKESGSRIVDVINEFFNDQGGAIVAQV